MAEVQPVVEMAEVQPVVEMVEVQPVVEMATGGGENAVQRCMFARQGEACENGNLGLRLPIWMSDCPGWAKHARTEFWVYRLVPSRMLRALRVVRDGERT